MENNGTDEETGYERVARGITMDFLRCNRCGKCREVCPITGSENVEWASARGKMEIAEAFFRGEDVDEMDVRRIFDLCLHCKACEENCPSGARGDMIVISVLSEMGRRGIIPLFKKAALFVLGRADRFIFGVMRMFGLAGKVPLHGSGGRSFLRYLYPLLGLPRQKLLPLPSGEQFINPGKSSFPASGVELTAENLNSEVAAEEDFNEEAGYELMELVRRAREENMKKDRTVCFFTGDAVNQFFSEEAQDIVFVLNLLGVNVTAPGDQACCGAPALYAGDARGAEREAARLIGVLSGYEFDWLVTSCASGGLMLRTEYPNLLGLTDDGYSGVVYDPEKETYHCSSEGSEPSGAGRLYLRNISGRVRDINELVAGMLGYKPGEPDYQALFSGNEEKEKEEAAEKCSESGDGRPVVVYHHPCHLNRGQKIKDQPEFILKKLPGVRFREMENADVCCGGSGLFSFAEPEISARVGREKAGWIAEAAPDIVATSCPACRIQLSDMLQRDYHGELPMSIESMRRIPVVTPIQLLARDLRRMLAGARE